MNLNLLPFSNFGGHSVLGWLSHYAKSQEIAGSIPEEVIGFFT
jgi:hypothetical protein